MQFLSSHFWGKHPKFWFVLKEQRLPSQYCARKLYLSYIRLHLLTGKQLFNRKPNLPVQNYIVLLFYAYLRGLSIENFLSKLQESCTRPVKVLFTKGCLCMCVFNCLTCYQMPQMSVLHGLLAYTLCMSLRWLDRVFQGQYPPSLSMNNVAINKDFEKLPSWLF